MTFVHDIAAIQNEVGVEPVTSLWSLQTRVLFGALDADDFGYACGSLYLIPGGPETVPQPAVTFPYVHHSRVPLLASIQECESGNYYDFATKQFKAKPMVPRAGLAYEREVAPGMHLHSAVVGRSGNLNGNYVVTVRDQRSNQVVALLAYAIADNQLVTADRPVGLEQFRAERDLPPPVVNYQQTARAGRGVEID